MDRCKGVENTITPEIAEIDCPQCGAELEMFSTDESVTCDCGYVVYNKRNSALSVGAETE
ncbi:MAG: hypothetical protein LBD92_02225 [Oscillospiraceae bacterium]|jgi:DNA-directed RNA polymerase subunit RPC12/RpoP|nr:hypothetical protein [Oscillospiraceae bacterium]